MQHIRSDGSNMHYNGVAPIHNTWDQLPTLPLGNGSKEHITLLHITVICVSNILYCDIL